MELYWDIHEMCKPSFLKYSIYFNMPIDIPLWKTNAEQKKVTLLWTKKYCQKQTLEAATGFQPTATQFVNEHSSRYRTCFGQKDP